jgi:hypothetical protein
MKKSKRRSCGNKQEKRVYTFSYSTQKGQNILSGEMYNCNKSQNEAAAQVYLQIKEQNDGWTVTDLKCLCHMGIQEFNDSELPFFFNHDSGELEDS